MDSVVAGAILLKFSRIYDHLIEMVIARREYKYLFATRNERCEISDKKQRYAIQEPHKDRRLSAVNRAIERP
jgi:hypothetical protein